MGTFDAAQEWIILSDGFEAAEELRQGITLIREKLGVVSREVPIRDAREASEAEGENAILLNLDGEPGADAFSWRSGENRIELYGNTRRALFFAAVDLLDAMGLSWPNPQRPAVQPIIPDVGQGTVIKLKRSKAWFAKGPRRLALQLPLPLWERDAAIWIEWAARRLYTSVFFITSIETGRSREAEKGQAAWLGVRERASESARRLGMEIELGGYALSGLLGKGLFWRHRDLFRMSGGKRTADANLCPTNPEALAKITRKAAADLFPLGEVTGFHLWADRVAENSWCSCPTCRAFSMREQTLMALDAVADALAKERPSAWIGWIDVPDGECSLAPRKNLREVMPPGEQAPDQFLVRLSKGVPVNLGEAAEAARSIRTRA